MEPERIKNRTEITDREKVKFRKELLIYLFFLSISFACWYLIALSKDHVATISYPVRYERLPKGKVLVTDLPLSLQFQVKGQGFSIVKHKFLTFLKPISIPLSGIPLDTIENPSAEEYILHTHWVKEYIANQLSEEIHLIHIQPDTLHFVFADVVERKIPVKYNLTASYEKQYLPYGYIKTDPDSILVSGPQAIIDTMQFVHTAELKLKNIKETQTKQVDIITNWRLTYNRSKVWVIIPVQKYTELTFSVPIEIENKPQGYSIKTFPAQISVSCMVAVSDYEKISPAMFRPAIDYATLADRKLKKAKVNLIKAPENVQDIRFYPKNVEYLIEK